jgi:hypothetical protein
VPLDHPHSRTPVGVDPQTIPRPFFALDGRGENQNRRFWRYKSLSPLSQ